MFGYAGTALLLAAASVFLARRWVRRRGSGGPLTDEQIRAIESRGRLEAEEPLDLGEIRRAEDEFWEEERWE